MLTSASRPVMRGGAGISSCHIGDYSATTFITSLPHWVEPPSIATQ